MTREKAVEIIDSFVPSCICEADDAFQMAIKALQEPERAHGRWNIMSDYKMRRCCSACGWDVPDYGRFYSYCPNCGAKMDAWEEESP